MPTFKDIKELRQAGHLTDAHQQAAEWLANDPDNVWAKRALSWVLYDLTKQEATNNNWEQFLSNIDEFGTLGLGAGEEMVYDNLCYQIGKMIFSKVREENYNARQTYNLFEKIQNFSFTKPSEAFSYLLKSLHKGVKGSPYYQEVISWWNLEYLRNEDFQEEEYNGKRMMSIGEQVIIAYSKSILEGESNQDNPFDSRTIDKEKVHQFLPVLDAVISRFPNLKYPSYYKGKLLLAVGSAEEALEAFLPFAQKNKSQFWVWDIMGDFYASQPEKAIALYSNALLCKSPEEFLIKVREKLAALLINTSKYPEAKFEIEKVLQVRTSNGWRVPHKLLTWQQSPWYAAAQSPRNNVGFYRSVANDAMQLLYGSVAPEVAVIEFVNKEKQVASWMISKRKRGFFKYRSFIKNPKVGDTINLYLVPGNRRQEYEVINAELVEADSSLIKRFNGSFKLHPGGKFGFVGDIFVAGDFLSQLKDGDVVAGRALMSYNKKREEWGWKCFELK